MSIHSDKMITRMMNGQTIHELSRIWANYANWIHESR